MVQNQKGYESWYESFEGKQESKFMTWYHSYAGKKAVNTVYSLGASVVIIGALFKIMHFPGAGPVLMTGMITEAFLFMIGVLEAPHEEFHWGNVFPELIEYGSPDERVARSKAQLGLATAPAMGGAATAPKAGVSPLSDKELEALKGSLNDLAKTAGQLSELGKVATAGNKLGENMEAASEAAAKYAASANVLGDKAAVLGEAYTSIAADMQTAAANTKDYSQAVTTMGQKLGSLNSVYELQLNAINDANTKVQAVAANFDKLQAATAESLKSQEMCSAAQQKLAQQVADLNKIYGNMLNALA